MDVARQCLGCGSIYDNSSKLISLPTKQNHQCSANHTGPWTAIQMNGQINEKMPQMNGQMNGYNNGMQQNQYIQHQQQQYHHHHQQQHQPHQQPPPQQQQPMGYYVPQQPQQHPHQPQPQPQPQQQQQYNYNNNYNNNVGNINGTLVNATAAENNNNNHNNNDAQMYHHQQKSSSFKPSSPRINQLNINSSIDEKVDINMEIDLSKYEPILIETFLKEIHEYNTEIELTFGETINFIEKLTIFIYNIDNDKMSDIISIVVSKRQDGIVLSETIINNNQNMNQQSKIRNNNNQIDQKPVYVRSILQLIYYSFLNYIYNDYKYKDFYKAYYTIDEFENDKNNKNETNNKNQTNDKNNTLKIPNKSNDAKSKKIIKLKSKSARFEEVDPFFQCFYECCIIYNLYQIRENKNFEVMNDLRKYLELITSNIIQVLKLMNGIIIWINKIKTNSIHLILEESNIDISLYEFSQLLQCIHLQTQHAVWQRISKNSENQISDKQNLSLCIHILLCIAIKDKDDNNNAQNPTQYPNTQNPNKIYAEFLDKIVTCLIQNFIIPNSKNKKIIMEFGDLVEKLPLWLLHCDKLLQSQQ